jgi:4-aminobutyrate aminotransferase-like enzyme/Ser/Thr protein kinase RdoA (MazF antagonist)
MPSLIHPLPDVSPATAAEILRTHWNIGGTLRPLPGERDRNFHVYTGDGREFVLKIATAMEDVAVLEFQDAALSHIAARAPAAQVPQPVSSLEGKRIEFISIGGELHATRLLTWLAGRTLADTAPHSSALLRSLGQSLGQLAAALTDFEHPAARRTLKWDLSSPDWAVEHVHRLVSPARREQVSRILDEFVRNVRPALRETRAQVVHNDANDHNILTTLAPDGSPSVSGIIDFGDLLYSHPACDLAIALAYAMMGKPDPLTAASHVVAGYHAAFPLAADELRLLLPLVRTRLAASLTNAAIQAEAEPGNAYLQVSATAAGDVLDRLEGVHDRFAEFRFRDACGLTPCEAGLAVSQWISRQKPFAPILGTPLLESDVVVHDFSVSSVRIGTIDTWRDQRLFSQLAEDEIRVAGARAGVGRYDEVRAIYTTDLFRLEGNDGPEWRTVHIGIDVGAAVGTAVHAPLDGIVHSMRDNDAPGDYGPTIVLEHPATDERPIFWTLYGHLDRESLTAVVPGEQVKAGAIVGRLGNVDVNGGWWPHVHVQVICELFGRSGDFQGVASPDDRNVMLSVCPDPTVLLGLPAASRAPRPASTPELVERRRAVLGPSLSISYRTPLHIVRGVMQHLVDSNGRRYLDTVNNVAHVGHAHPDVVRAGQRQMAALNTNTRYLHEEILAYADALRATLPDDLSICWFVNSGSEANELALRMARAWAGERDFVVMESGYHGNTSALIDVSHYKYAGPGGEGAPAWVHVVPMPDTYRGPFGKDDTRAGHKYAQAVRDAVGRILGAGRRPAGFLHESILSCGGQIPLPPGYLSEAYRHVRAAGGVCIADEVQTGLGRVGGHWWAFEEHGVVPDIVTMGKPLGNGHPLGAVVTTADVAARFANGMEYFNTFGGNPVSCAIGREVLAVIRREELRRNAVSTGNALVERLHALGERHQLIGDVRGSGLFLGIELVTDRDSRTPAGTEAAYIANRMRDGGVLMSTDGPHHNVLKIKPPMCFSRDDADFLVETLDRVLAETALR